MEMVLEVVFDVAELFSGIIFDLVETKIERAKCIKKVRKKKNRL